MTRSDSDELRCLIVEDQGQWAWSLTVIRRAPGEEPHVLASKALPHDGAVYFSSEDRPTRLDTRSESQLDIEDVVERYSQHSDTETPRVELRRGVQAALRELRPAASVAGGEA
jgi:hypothetical protein